VFWLRKAEAHLAIEFKVRQQRERRVRFVGESLAILPSVLFPSASEHQTQALLSLETAYTLATSSPTSQQPGEAAFMSSEQLFKKRLMV